MIQTLRNGNVMRLVIAQALAGANTTVIYATAAIIGNALAPDPTLSTLPITTFVIGMALSTLPTGLIANRFGRRASFLTGNACGIAAGLLSALAIWVSSFWLFCLAMMFGGIYAAVVLTFRFAAAECVPANHKAQALSAVMVGGVAAGVLGPQMVNFTMGLYEEHIFSATYLFQAGVAALSACILSGIKIPRVTKTEFISKGRTLSEIALKPAFLIAVTCGVVSYSLMNLLMTSAPLAMHMHGHTQESSNTGLQWHVIGMYAPSLFTGALINRYGARFIVFIGIILIGAAAAVGLAGLSVNHFWWSLILLGVGWNFGFIGASAMVLETHRPEEKNKVQALNDFLIFGSMVIASLSSGGVLSHYGWVVVCEIAFPPIVLSLMILLANSLRFRKPKVSE